MNLSITMKLITSIKRTEILTVTLKLETQRCKHRHCFATLTISSSCNSTLQTYVVDEILTIMAVTLISGNLGHC